MEKRIRDLEANAILLKKKSDLLEAILEKRDKEKVELLDNLEEKEKSIHELKMKGNGICENGCHRYNKSMDDVVKAGFKHKGDAIAMKEVAENLRKKIKKLKDENSKLFEEKKQHEEDANDGYDMLQNVKERDKILKIKLEENKVCIQKQDAEIKDFRDEKDLVESMKSSIEKKKKVSDRIIKDLQLENENLVKDKRKRLNAVEMKETVHHRELNGLKTEIEEIKKTNACKEHLLITLNNENDELRKKVKNVEEENGEYRTEVEKLKLANVDESKVVDQKWTSKSLEEELELLATFE